jgi:hypothetical protein
MLSTMLESRFRPANAQTARLQRFDYFDNDDRGGNVVAGLEKLREQEGWGITVESNCWAGDVAQTARLQRFDYFDNDDSGENVAAGLAKLREQEGWGIPVESSCWAGDIDWEDLTESISFI